MRAGIDTLAAKDTLRFIQPKFPVRVEREDLPRADADAGSAVHTFCLIETDAMLEDTHMRPEADHPLAHESTLLVRHIDERLALR